MPYAIDGSVAGMSRLKSGVTDKMVGPIESRLTHM